MAYEGLRSNLSRGLKVGLLDRLSGFCNMVHAKLEIPPDRLHWSDSLHWMKIGDTLVFSGSDSIVDWSHNLKFWPTRSPTGPGYVHSGFLNLARKTWPQLKDFACPAVGDKSWASHYPHFVRRCYVKPDLVTVKLFREHVGKEIAVYGGWNPIKNHRTTLERFWFERASE